MLYMLGAVVFELLPINVHEAALEYGHDYAAKDVIGAMKPHEAMGPSTATVNLSGKLITHRFGIGDWGTLHAMADSGAPQMLMRGDGRALGWHVIEKVKEKHTYLDPRGVGRIVEFEIELKQTPHGPSASALLSSLMSLFS